MKRLLQLALLLSALALGASIVRAIAQLQLVSSVGGFLTVRTLLLLETGNWLGWSVWAMIVAAVMTRQQDRPGGVAGTLVRGTLLALAPLVAVPLISSPWHYVVTGSPGLLHSATHIAGHNLATNLLLGVAMIAVAQGRVTHDRTRALERTAAELRTQLAESQLSALRARLDPHFLFNALNSAMVLARRDDGPKVERLLEHLSALLRHSLDAAGAQLVPLRVELEVLRHYLDIEQVRHGERLRVRFDVEAGVENRLVPSLVLQPLVENAVHHGFSDRSRVLTVSVLAKTLGSSLLLAVDDDGPGLTSSAEKKQDGIGLGHTRDRLKALYGDRARLSIKPGTGGRGVQVTIELPSDGALS
ncbi:MAG TPA: histidine kinase [Gemmatimonadaceae bacterium]